LDDLAQAAPGTGDVMASVGRCFGEAWHAGQAGNFDLAAYFIRRTRTLLRKLVVLRPKYSEQVAMFDHDFLEVVYQALMAHDVAAFTRSYERAVDRANFYHVDTGHPYIVWHAPGTPPDPSLELG
jgi:hypothetical protein